MYLEELRAVLIVGCDGNLLQMIFAAKKKMLIVKCAILRVRAV